MPWGIVGGRLYHVITHPSDYFYAGADLWRTLYFWEGGLAIFGAVLFGAAGAYVACHRVGLRFLSFADALAPGMLIAQAMGRLGNYFDHELYGAPTSLPWGLQIESTNAAFPVSLPSDTLFQPLFLYEILWNLLGVIVIILAERQFDLRWGRRLGLYLVWYGFGRAWLEALRLDPTELQLAGLKVNMVTALAAALIGFALILVQWRRHREPELSPYSSTDRSPSDVGVSQERPGTAPNLVGATAMNRVTLSVTRAAHQHRPVKNRRPHGGSAHPLQSDDGRAETEVSTEQQGEGSRDDG